MFFKSKNAALWAILITSILFGLGHIASAPGQPIGVIIAKVVWATALGVYFGSAYVRTRNLWVPIILHALLNFAGVPFCFTQVVTYPMIGVIVCLITYLLLAAFGLYTLTKTDHSSQSGGL
jgi:membrane protease YdiL (CAAX protease family)